MKLLKTIAVTIVAAVSISTFNATGVFADTTKEVSISAHDSNILSQYGVEIISIKEDNEKRVVESIEKGVETKATLDKVNNVLSLEVDGKETVSIDLNAIEESPSMETFASVGEKTYSNYEYEINMDSTPYKWQLRRPDPNSIVDWFYKDVIETSSKLPTLNNFRTQVERINKLEFDFLVSSSVGILSTVISIIATAISAGVGAGALLVAAGVTGNSLVIANDLFEACEEAEYYYHQVW